jgi:predicted nuclease of predicted toxin-antitoxin system
MNSKPADQLQFLKDTDFYARYLISNNYLKVVYFKLGNLRLSDMHQYFHKFWPVILSKLEVSSFIIAQIDKITVIR